MGFFSIWEVYHLVASAGIDIAAFWTFASAMTIGVIIEIMDEYGKMIKGDDLKQFADIYNLTFVSIEELYDEVYNKDSAGSVPLSAVDEKTLESMAKV